MGVSIEVEWPGSTEDQRGNHPGFRNDDHMWAEWMVNVIQRPELVRLLERIGAGVLLYHNTTNLPKNNISWATPEEFEGAATTLRNLLVSQDARIKPLADVYRAEWDRLIGEGGGETMEDWFARDLEDVATIAHYARAHGAKKMTLGYYW